MSITTFVSYVPYLLYGVAMFFFISFFVANFNGEGKRTRGFIPVAIILTIVSFILELLLSRQG